MRKWFVLGLELDLGFGNVCAVFPLESIKSRYEFIFHRIANRKILKKNL
jgi:hypothetical protein